METFHNLSLHSVVFLLLLIHHSSAFRFPLCHDGDRSSLLHLKRSFVFDNYTKLASWKHGENCCLWDGVDCDAKTGHVIGLDLSSSCVYGSINSSSPLFRLVNLKSLDLSYNNFNLSAIPGAIRSLSQLKHLNLTYSHFIGQIPSGILELSNLVSLRLSLNSLVLKKPSLKDVVESFAHLEELHLTGVTIASQVPQSLLNLTSLSSLLLENCSLSGQFSPGVFRLPNLVILYLRSNPNLTGYLPEFDNVSSQLEEVWLDGTRISGRLPDSVGNLKSLRVFSAEECRLGGVIPSSAGNLSNLDTLDLSRNYFLGKMPSTLGNILVDVN